MHDPDGPVLPAAVRNVAHGWRREPALIALGNRPPVIAAALWTRAAGDNLEVSAAANADIHSIAVAGGRFEAETWVDGRKTHGGALSDGLCNIIRAGERPRGVFSGAWRMIHIYLPGAILRHTMEASAVQAHAVELLGPRWARDAIIERVAAEMLVEMREGDGLSRLRMDLLGQEIAVRLLRGHSNLAGTSGLLRWAAEMGRGCLTRMQVERACEMMDAHIDGDIGLAELAASVGLSASHFSRAFRRAVGIPPFAWLVRRRIERAKQLMADPSLPLAEIALTVGFSAQPQFTTAFRRATGTTPGAWRRAHRA